jgi:hypothetical protein
MVSSTRSIDVRNLAAGPVPFRRRLLGQPVLFETAYTWLVIVSVLDIVFTWLILRQGGAEANALAARIIQSYGLQGMVLFKSVMIVFVISLCEFTGHRRLASGRLLAWSAALISTLPVIVGACLMAICLSWQR